MQYILVHDGLLFWGFEPKRDKMVSIQDADAIASANGLGYAETLTKTYQGLVLIVDQKMKILGTEKNNLS